MELEAVKKAKQGDTEEIGNIILENMQSMYRVAFSILKSEEEISDAISNTVVKVFEKIGSLRKEEFFKTWLTRILINECYKIYNQNKKIVYLENYDQFNMPYEDTYEDMEIKKIVKQLDKDLRETVILYYFEDFSVKEISKTLKIPVGTVKSRLSRARNKLQERLVQSTEQERGISNE